MNESLNFLQLDFQKSVEKYNVYVLNDYIYDTQILTMLIGYINNIINGQPNILSAKLEFYKYTTTLYNFLKNHNFDINSDKLSDEEYILDNIDHTLEHLYKSLNDINNIINDNNKTNIFIYHRDLYIIADTLNILNF